MGSVRRLSNAVERVVHPVGTLLVAWAALGVLLGTGKEHWPRVFNTFWVQIPGSCLQALLLAAAALIAMWKAAHAARGWCAVYAALASLVVLLQLACAGTWYYDAYVAAHVVVNGVRAEKKRADLVTRLVAQQSTAAVRGEPLFPTRKRAAFMYYTTGAATTYRDDTSGATRLFDPSPAEAAQQGTAERQIEEARKVLALVDDVCFQSFRLGCINLAGLGLTALAACLGAARLRRPPERKLTDADGPAVF